MGIRFFPIWVALLTPVLCLAQYGYPYPYPYPSIGDPGAKGGPYSGPAVTFHGKLKQITKKEVVIISSEDQEIVLRRTHKTKFLKGNKEIKPSEIREGTAVTLDVSKDADMKPVAVNVFVDQPKRKSATSSAATSK